MKKGSSLSALLLVFIIVLTEPAAAQPALKSDRRIQSIPISQKTPAPKIPEGIALQAGLSEDDAVAIALWNNAAFQAELSALGITRADLLEAGQLRNPTLQMLLPVGYKQFEMLLNMPAEVFWQRPRRVEAAKIEVERVSKGLEQNGLELIRDVRVAFSGLMLAQDRSRFAGEAVELRRQISALTEIRFRLGDISELEANAAKVDLSVAEEQAARIALEVKQAHDRLRFLIGLEAEQLAFDIKPEKTNPGSANPEPQIPTQPKEALMRDALSYRPDLRAAALAIEAAAGRAKWERSRLFAFAGLLSIKQGAGLDFSPRGGLLAELPVLNRNKGAISRADAEVERAGLQYLAVHHRISQEVREAYSSMQQATESLHRYRTRILPQTLEGLHLAEKAYQNGDESYLFVLEAARGLTDARMREVDLSHQLRSALAQLDRSIGRKHDAIH